MEKPQVIIMLGFPASGKGTQAKILAKRIGYEYFGTGDLLRSEVEKGSDLGKKFARLMEAGELVPDDLTDPLVKDRLSDLKNSGIILDGYPRNLNQAKVLKEVFPDENFFVLNIEVSPKSLLKRMQMRRICEDCGKIFTLSNDQEANCDSCGGKLIQRADDSQEVLTKRIETYNNLTKPIIGYYSEKGILKNINGEPPIEDVTKEIEKVI